MTSVLVIFFSATLGSIVFGYALRRLLLGYLDIRDEMIYRISKYTKLFTIAIIEPIPLINSFWTLQLVSSRLLLLILFGVIYAAVSMVAAEKTAKRAGYDSSTSASFFVCVSFTNFVTFGGLAALLLFGTTGYGLVILSCSASQIVNYVYGYMISHNIAEGHAHPFKFSLYAIRRSLVILVPVVSILIGLLLRVTPLEHQPIWNTLTGILVPMSSALFGISFGMTLRVSNIRKYARVIALILAVKYLVVPVLVIPVFLFMGMHQIMNGQPLYILVLLMYMPVAINALVPPVLYDFDLDLVNSAWLVTTVSMIFFFPVILLMFQGISL